MNAKHFCAGMLFIIRKFDDKCFVRGATDHRFVDEVKFPGGTNEHAPWEDEEQTFLREYAEETGFVPTKYREIFREEVSGHQKVFFLVTEFEGELAFEETREITESDGEKITVRWWGLEEFAEHLYWNNHKPFAIVLNHLAVDSGFFKRYANLIRRFPVSD